MTRRKRNITFLVVGLLVGLLLATRGPWRARQTRTSTRQATPAGEFCPVVRVVDGDAVRVMFGGKNESVRLLRIDTVERGEPGYQEAGAALAELLGNRPVCLEFETPGKVERDRFGRLLCYVFVGDLNANVEMVRLGWSKFWTRYGRGRLADQFGAAEAEAEAHGRGLAGFDAPGAD